MLGFAWISLSSTGFSERVLELDWATNRMRKKKKNNRTKPKFPDESKRNQRNQTEPKKKQTKIITKKNRKRNRVLAQPKRNETSFFDRHRRFVAVAVTDVVVVVVVVDAGPHPRGAGQVAPDRRRDLGQADRHGTQPARGQGLRSRHSHPNQRQ